MPPLSGQGLLAFSWAFFFFLFSFSETTVSGLLAFGSRRLQETGEGLAVTVSVGQQRL